MTTETPQTTATPAGAASELSAGLDGLAKSAGFKRTKMHKSLRRFAELVAAAEREACAKVCDKRVMYPDGCDVAKTCAIEIRERSNAKVTGAQQRAPEAE